MHYPDAYIAYLVEFHATRDFFECHELLEEYWKKHAGDGCGDIWVGLIQTAVGQYHERRGNLSGAAKMYGQALRKLRAAQLEILGLDGDHLSGQLEARRKAAETGRAGYCDIGMRITDETLIALCEKQCMERGLRWGLSSMDVKEEVIHRHLTRDRTEVVTARAAALKARREGNKR
jgi:predicted metal-dependent hydrolase